MHQLSPNVRNIRPLVSSSSYYPPSSMVSPLTYFDAHEMADSIRRIATHVDIAIAADIAAQMEIKSISGQDFLNLTLTGLRTLSQNNDQVLQELRKLQRITPDEIVSLSHRSPSIENGFPELAQLIHSHRLPSGPSESFSGGANNMGIGNVMDHINDSGSSTMLGPQISEEFFNCEPFDYGDERDLIPDIHSTVIIVGETSPQIAESVLQDDMSLLDHWLQLDSSVDPTLEDWPPLAPSTFSNLGNETSALEQAHTSEGDGFINGSNPQNDLAVPFLPNTHTRTATPPAGDDTIHIYSTDAELQPIRDKPITPTMTFYADDEVSVYEPDQSDLDSLSVDGVEGDLTLLQIHSDLDSPINLHGPPRSSLLTLSYVDEDQDAPVQPSEMPLDGNVPHPTPRPDPDTKQDELSLIASDSLEGSQSEKPPTPSLDHLQILIDTPVTEDEEALEPPYLPASEPVATLSTSLSIHDTLPFILETPSNSPIFEGLSQYMTLHGSDTPATILKENSGVNLDKALTPVQREISATERTLRPPSEAPRIGLFSSTSENGRSLSHECSQPTLFDNFKSTLRSDTDITIQSNLHCPHFPSHIQIRELNGDPSLFQRLQLGLLNVTPTLFALSRESTNRANIGLR